jgi:hypothetical protein
VSGLLVFYAVPEAASFQDGLACDGNLSRSTGAGGGVVSSSSGVLGNPLEAETPTGELGLGTSSARDVCCPFSSSSFFSECRTSDGVGSGRGLLELAPPLSQAAPVVRLSSWCLLSGRGDEGSRCARPATPNRLYRVEGWIPLVLQDVQNPWRPAPFLPKNACSVQWRGVLVAASAAGLTCGDQGDYKPPWSCACRRCGCTTQFSAGIAELCSSRHVVAPCELPWCLVLCHCATCRRLLMCSLAGSWV